MYHHLRRQPAVALLTYSWGKGRNEVQHTNDRENSGKENSQKDKEIFTKWQIDYHRPTTEMFETLTAMTLPCSSALTTVIPIVSSYNHLEQSQPRRTMSLSICFDIIRSPTNSKNHVHVANWLYRMALLSLLHHIYPFA